MSATIPVALRVHLAHAAVQAIAEEAGADVLHLKGPALDGVLRPTRQSRAPGATEGDTEPVPRLSTDVDVLVRPAHVKGLLHALQQHGWRYVTHFETGSAFEHAASLWHTELGYVDVHRIFPGVSAPPKEAFAQLWSSRHPVRIAARPCQVPSIEFQRLLLILHGAREGGLSNPDVDLVWTRASEQERTTTLQLGRELGAEVALAAATGRLDEFRDHPAHDLWRLFSTRDTSDRAAEWKARLKAERTLAGRARIAARSLLVNTDHLAMERGRELTRTEVVREYGHRAGHAARALWAQRPRKQVEGPR
ncbi:MAG: nucleotidyltransferase family protein [Propionibacteriaceae bacterium]|nr:nucleotidyltransferase family protein [Propionibacteriaceae bacterium]